MHASVLIVDDEVVVAEDIRRQLRALGYTVVGVASSGCDAIRLGAEHRPDLILMDIQLKGSMDGIEAARTIHTRFDIPVIYLTAFSDDDTLERARHTLPLAYLIKPFISTDLRAAVELALFRHRITKAAEQRARWLETVVQSMPDAVVTIDEGGKVTLVNQAAEQLTGWDQEEAIGRPIDDIVAAVDRDTGCPIPRPAMAALFTGQVSASSPWLPVLLRRRVASEQLVSAHYRVIQNGNSTSSGAVIVFRSTSVSANG